MKLKRMMMAALLAATLSGLTASACIVTIRVACPNDTTASGILVCIDGVGCATTDEFGIAEIPVPGFDTYTVRVDASTLPAGAKLSPQSKSLKVISDAAYTEFDLSGAFCETPPPPGPCWLTGGGTIGKGKGAAPAFNFGGVVYPGCSPKAADGGNWNVVDHATGLHFQGQHFIVDSCSGEPTRSPKVNVNIIDFHGEGRLSVNGGSSDESIPVTFVGHAVDYKESGGGSDLLYLQVFDGGNTVMQVGSSAVPATISDGNLQIHTTSCNN